MVRYFLNGMKEKSDIEMREDNVVSFKSKESNYASIFSPHLFVEI